MTETDAGQPLRFLVDTRTVASVSAIALVSLLGLLLVDPPSRPIAFPAVVSVNILLAFVAILRNRDDRWPVAEVGTVCLFITTLYAVVPLVGFWLGGLRWSPQSDYRLYDHPPSLALVVGTGWQYSAYVASFAFAYLWVRGRWTVADRTPVESDRLTATVVAGTALVFAGFFVMVTFLYGVSYNPSYAGLRAGDFPAQAQLPRIVQQIASYGDGILLVAKLCLLAVLLQRWSRRRWRLLLLAWLAVEVFQAASRLGARRDVAMLLIAAVLLFDRLVRPLSFWQAALGVAGLLAGLMSYGYLRDLGHGQTSWTAMNEFQTLFANACDLQVRRAGGLAVPWQIYWSDLLRLIPSRWQGFLPFPVLDPSDWYLAVLGQDDGSTGLMFGVVAQAVIGCGFPEIIMRGACLGLVFAAIHRWYVRRSTSLWVTASYLFLCVWSYYTVRATTFHIAYFVVYRLVPALALMWTLRAVLRGGAPGMPSSVGGNRPGPSA